MALSTLRRLLGVTPTPASRPRRSRPSLEGLEDRCVPSTIQVDDDRAQCRNAQFTSINAAIAAARPGDTIRVCPGTYHESVLVNKSLNLVTDRHDRGDVIVDPPGTLVPGFDVQANNVLIRGFIIQGADNSAGINLSRSFSGYVIENNVLRDNTFGIYFNSNGARTSIVRNNAFLNNTVPGGASGNGIYSDQGVSNARIENNFFTGQDNAAILLNGNGSPAQAQTNIRITGNTLIDDATIALINTTNSLISRNLSVGSNGSGVFFGGGVSGVEVSRNVLKDGEFTGINLRFDQVNFNVSAPDTNNVIRDNVVSGWGDSGIRLRDGASGNLVVNNRVTDNGTGTDPTTGDGISLENADNNTIRGNRVEDNRRDGIRVDAASTGNLIERNVMLDNGEHDAHDDSTGSGTAGTANRWVRNFCETENRPGLCEHRRRDHDDDDDDDDDDHHGHGGHHGNGHDDHDGHDDDEHEHEDHDHHHHHKKWCK